MFVESFQDCATSCILVREVNNVIRRFAFVVWWTSTLLYVVQEIVKDGLAIIYTTTKELGSRGSVFVDSDD
jgi:hypothetical protein